MLPVTVAHHLKILTISFSSYSTNRNYSAIRVAIDDCKQLSREALATWIAVCDCQ
jgi:acyl-ACP thioesterase